MNHKINQKKLSRKGKHRTILLRNLVKSMISSERIKTTVAKAKELRKFIEKLITRSKNDSLHNKRIVSAKLGGYSKN
jgi:large subunit ribosomal protein L17